MKKREEDEEGRRESKVWAIEFASKFLNLDLQLMNKEEQREELGEEERGIRVSQVPKSEKWTKVPLN